MDVNKSRFNEEARLRERYVQFDIDALRRVAAAAVNRDRCTSIIKLAEGGFNKIFLLRMDDGYEVVTRIPTPIAGPPHYTTASEVATLRFLRTVLHVPVPEILAYSTDATNPVGAEYIILERLQGDSLTSRWLSLSTAELKEVLSQIVEVEEKLFSFSFPAYGSLYYKNDIPIDLQVDIGNKQTTDFCVGPISKRQFWHGEREAMQLDRGPCTYLNLHSMFDITSYRYFVGTKPNDFLIAAARRELAWISEYAKPQPRKTFLLQTDDPIDPNEHAKLLHDYMRLAPFLTPQEPELTSPILRHPDLSLANVILAPNSTKVLGIIDWQDAAILPLFAQAGYPAFCEHDMTKPQPLKQPKLPDNFESMDPVRKNRPG
ncbi:hypothetical protein Plec18170_004407 [Paecilomyces lecythidis]